MILAVAGLLVTILNVLCLIFAGILFGIFLHGISRSVSTACGFSYGQALTLVVVALASTCCGGLYYMGSQIAAQLTELAQQLRNAGETLTASIKQFEGRIPYLEDFSLAPNSFTGQLVPSVLYSVQSVIWGVTAVTVVVAVGLYLAYHPSLYVDGLKSLLLPPHRDPFDKLLKRIYSSLGYWLIGRILSMTIVGVLTSLGLWLLGVPLPGTLGVLAALLTFIPNIGPIIAAVPQSLVALQVGPDTVFYVLAFNVAAATGGKLPDHAHHSTL